MATAVLGRPAGRSFVSKAWRLPRVGDMSAGWLAAARRAADCAVGCPGSGVVAGIGSGASLRGAALGRVFRYTVR